MKQVHTPGPWEVSEQEDGSDAIKSKTRFIIIPDQGICGATVSEAVANARLIAAAPDMLAALIAIMAAIDADETSGRKLEGLTPEMSKARIAARTVIAKAERAP